MNDSTTARDVDVSNPIDRSGNPRVYITEDDADTAKRVVWSARPTNARTWRVTVEEVHVRPARGATSTWYPDDTDGIFDIDVQVPEEHKDAILYALKDRLRGAEGTKNLRLPQYDEEIAVDDVAADA